MYLSASETGILLASGNETLELSEKEKRNEDRMTKSQLSSTEKEKTL